MTLQELVDLVAEDPDTHNRLTLTVEDGELRLDLERIIPANGPGTKRCDHQLATTHVRRAGDERLDLDAMAEDVAREMVGRHLSRLDSSFLG